MNKLGVILGVIVIAIIAGVAASLSASPSETVNLDMGRTHGTISTAMGSPILGDPSAPITIVEFGDYQCEMCYRWFHTSKPQITENYIETGKANLVFIDLAFLGRDSSKAAQATYCAEDQEQYWAFHDMLYNSQERVDNGWANSERLKAFAFSLELDMELFESCLDSGKYSKRVDYNIQQAKKHGVNSTPTFIIVANDQEKQISGAQPFSVFKQILDTMI
jgi:protein-disulfide isomerase